MEAKVAERMKELENLVTNALAQPHAAHAALTHGLSSKLLFLTRTIHCIGPLLQSLDAIIRVKLIPALTGQPDAVRDLLALPSRSGGIAVTNPTSVADMEFTASTKITEPLKHAILQSFVYSDEVITEKLNTKSEVRKLKREQSMQAADSLKQSLPISFQRFMDLAQERGASSWLTSLPIQEFGFALHKGTFQDALALCYNWLPLRTPSNCACGVTFSVEHALSCSKGGFPSIRRNEISDLTANLLTEVCNDVCIEPDLQPIDIEVLTGSSSNTQDGAKLDIAANGFWGGRLEQTFFDFRVFNSHAPSNRNSLLASGYRKHELQKKRQYEQRVRLNMPPLLLSCQLQVVWSTKLCSTRG